MCVKLFESLTDLAPIRWITLLLEAESVELTCSLAALNLANFLRIFFQTAWSSFFE